MTADDIITWCRAYISDLLGVPLDSVDPDAPVDDFGFDSSGAVALVLDLETKLGRELDPSILFEHQTLRALANAVVTAAAA